MNDIKNTRNTPRKKTSGKKLLIIQIIVFLLILSGVLALFIIPGSKGAIDESANKLVSLLANQTIPNNSRVNNDFMAAKIGDEVSSTNAVLIDLASGEVMAAKRADEKIYPASMTKIMTAVLAIEYFSDLETQLTVPQDVYSYIIEHNASNAGLVGGEIMSVKDLLYCVILPSGADACLTLARRIGGTEQKFAELMTEKAHQIGAIHTNFVNCTGLHDDNHYSTVHDIALITQYALQNQTFRQVFTAKKYTTSPTNKHSSGVTVAHTMFAAITRSGLTNNYIIGGKTGFTDEACQCLASLATKNSRDYILITVGAGTMYSSQGTFHVKDAIYIYNNYV